MPTASIECAHCYALINIENDAFNHRVPCQKCGSIERVHKDSVLEAVIARDGIGLKAKRLGGKKPYVEEKSMPSYSHSLGKLVFHERLIDRENNQYREAVIDYESGAVIHQCDEPLSKHVGHGTARFKKDKPKT